MTLKNGETANVDEVLNLVGTNFKNQAQLLYNSAYIGFNSKLNGTGVPNLKNIKYDVFNTDTASSKNAVYYNSTDKLYYSWPFTASKGDAIANSTAEVTHNTNTYTLKKTISSINDYVYSTELEVAELGVSYGWYQIIYTYSDLSTATSTDNYFSGAYANRINVNPNPQKEVAKIDYYLKSYGTNVTYMRNVYVYECPDNETDPQLIFQTQVPAGHLKELLPTITDCIPTWNSQMGATIGDTLAQDLSEVSVTGVQTLTTLVKTITTSNSKVYGGTSDVKTSNASYPAQAAFKYYPVDGTAYFGNTVSTNSATYETLNHINPYPDLDIEKVEVYLAGTVLPTTGYEQNTYIKELGAYNTLVVSISADGTNYETVTDATIHRFTNTGTNLYIKFEIDRVNTSAVDKISEYAILYNCTGEV